MIEKIMVKYWQTAVLLVYKCLIELLFVSYRIIDENAPSNAILHIFPFSIHVYYLYCVYFTSYGYIMKHVTQNIYFDYSNVPVSEQNSIEAFFHLFDFNGLLS